MTKSVSVTYKAPPGDSKVVEVFGHTFYSGKAETVVVDDRTLEKLKGNRNFEVGKVTDAEPGQAPADPAAAARAKAEDDAKLAAQGAPPLSRGAVLNKPEEDHPHDEDEGAADGGRSFPQAGRDR